MVNNQVILITGTRKGIGRYLVEHFVNSGFDVIGCSRKPVDYEFKNYRHFCLDISDEAKVKQMFAEIRKTYNRLDVLVNNAGIISTNYALLTPLQTVQNVFATNFVGTFLSCREAAKIMQKNRYGRIVNISTISVCVSPPGTSIYSASKAAVEQFSKVLAKEVTSFGITSNTLSLSFVKESGMAEKMSKKIIEETLEKTISKSWLSINDIANAIDFLISPNSSKVTGQTIYLGGV